MIRSIYRGIAIVVILLIYGFHMWELYTHIQHHIVAECGLRSCEQIDSYCKQESSNTYYPCKLYNISFVTGPQWPNTVSHLLIEINGCPSNMFLCYYDDRDPIRTFSLNRVKLTSWGAQSSAAAPLLIIILATILV